MSVPPSRPRAVGPYDPLVPTRLAELPSVIHDYPAAVLLVDIASSSVVFVNDLAQQLAPGVISMPVPIDDWSRAAGLQVVGGGTLEASTTPLALIAVGEPAGGREVNAELQSQAAGAREGLWVIGLPLDAAPEPLRSRALLVLLPLRFPEAISVVQNAAATAQAHHSVLASDLALAISDATVTAAGQEDPVIWVNAGFERITGYPAEEVLGRNCRFLQGPDTDREAVARLRLAMDQGVTAGETLLNYRKDGSAFFNHVVISPVHDAAGRMTHRVSVQTDVTQRVLARQEWESAQEEADLARRGQVEAEQAGAFGRLLLTLSEALTDTETVTDIAATIAEVAAREVGATGSGLVLFDDFRTRLEFTSTDQLPEGAADVLRSTVLSEEVPIAVAARTRSAIFREDGAYLPLEDLGEVLGVLVLLWNTPRPLGPQERAVIASLAQYTAQAVHRAMLLGERRTAAQVLQESLLTRLPEVAHLELAARYVPAATRDQVGGDWYDAVELSDGSVALVIGDVTGHDITAAARMGQMRGLLRAFVYDRQEQPADIVCRLDRTMEGLRLEGMATLVLARLDTRGEDHTLVWANAGHPPPIVLHPDGVTELLDVAPDIPVGVIAGRTRQDHIRGLPPGATLLLYTDGFIEHRGRRLADGIQELRNALQRHHQLPLAQLLDQLVVELVGEEPEDDCALLAARL